jgi:hypothetical protein
LPAHDRILPGEEGTFSHTEATMKEQKCTTPEEPETQAYSFVVRIWRQMGPADPECRGWVEHVQSGQRTFFLGLDRLLPIIATHVGIPIRQRKWWRSGLIRWQARLARYLPWGGEKEGGERPESMGRG